MEQTFVSAVLVAAGSSRRMGGENKLLLPLAGEPVVVHTARAFERCAEIDEIIIVTKTESIPQFEELMRAAGIGKCRAVTAGGGTRQESVLNGVMAANRACTHYAIHDGARPLCTPALLRRVIKDAVRYGAATAGVPAKDTMKIVDSRHMILDTPDRASLYHTQTPQVFEAALYRTAAEAARTQGRNFTDDCQLLENSGVRVYMSEGAYTNIKITTPEDLLFARAVLAERGKPV